jgi:hypothetical protein
MIQPLLGRSRFSQSLRSLPGKAWSLFGSWIKGLVEGLAIFFKALREGTGGERLSPVSEKALRHLEDNLLEGYSPAKKRELRRSISLFARLIYWGAETLKVPWKPSHVPIEYCTLLAAAGAPSEAILRAGGLFEKALYSAGPLSHKEREEFKTLVEGITQ